jgi:pimeloyl-ACP methyl ester carboxylesterase
MSVLTPRPGTALLKRLYQWFAGIRLLPIAHSTSLSGPIKDARPADSADQPDPHLACRMHTYPRVLPPTGQVLAGRRTFVLVHGLGMSARYFDTLGPVLREHGDVLVPDLPGSGGLPTPQRAMSVRDGAASLGEALDAHGITSCMLIGQSMGAQFVTDLAHQRPDVVSHVVLIGPVTDTAHNSALRQALALLGDAVLEKPSTNRLVARSYAQCGIPWYRSQLTTMLTYPLQERLAELHQPALILRGSRDIIANHTWCRKLAAKAQRGQLITIKAQPHAVDRNAASPATAAILNFLDQD